MTTPIVDTGLVALKLSPADALLLLSVLMGKLDGATPEENATLLTMARALAYALGAAAEAQRQAITEPPPPLKDKPRRGRPPGSRTRKPKLPAQTEIPSAQQPAPAAVQS